MLSVMYGKSVPSSVFASVDIRECCFLLVAIVVSEKDASVSLVYCFQFASV